MVLAEILSDLVSLRVCDPTAALALVTASPKPKTTTTTTDPSHVQDQRGGGGGAQKDDDDDDDVDLRRAKELVELHYSVREAHRRGELGRALTEARERVQRAVGGS
ncbi:hypothetical protein K505DRAFT_231790 [Melanomma pulvis-pyrius CBS 109.77]|uniref:Uncharacterized protein n=1 Tax=Melanomma pulvis-pyrius CBS 109.77 TaxID=1314802 RepID=A0A6A6XU55_9PLEO|nr:hypothetical protein K505DRAFT_231790 [Melanomma pulvis-pyrius CBS 109.77]